ncbi:trinucleotide repeat-containing gene 6C protein isoform X3 [Salmo salar]|uniref:Trinucleotide repeat-containing gene 6C protein isoform X3 n=1 Tax=Salmo salar TaxID=8030 RepID=A0ABM3EKI1_SALSA|nr:trinucleotide repeat-containing gene 6C protein-like isoform X3 [Salmo salar]
MELPSGVYKATEDRETTLNTKLLLVRVTFEGVDHTISREKKQGTRDQNHLMEEKKKRRQEEKKKKEAAQKKVTEQKTKVPDSAKPGPTPPPPPANPSATPSVPPTSGSNGKRASSSAQQQSQPSPAQQRYPPREIPPRFRQQEHKQLLKRGQPLPPGTLPTVPGRPEPDSSQKSSGASHTELPPQSGPGAYYENPHWGHQPANRSATSASASANHSGWDTVIINESDTEAWPSISRSSQSQSQGPAGGCPSDTDPVGPASSSSMSMATGANGQTGHFPANYPSSKGASSGPGSSANHPGAGMVGMASSQGAANRGWGSGPGPSPHGPPQSSSVVGGEGKSDGPMGGGGGRGWGSSSSTNFNLNLNPNANPSAWPVLGHDGGGGAGGSSSGGANPNQPPSSQPPPNLCNPPGTSPAQGNSNRGGTMVGGTNGNLPVGGGSTWGESSEPHPSSSTNVSFSSEPQNLNTDGPNHTSKQQEPPIHSVSGWSGPSGGMGSLGQPPPGASQLVNGEDGSSVWGNNGDSKSVASSAEPSGWDSGAGGWGSHGSSGGGTSGGWGGQSSGDAWGKQHSGEGQGGWEAPSSTPQQASSWSTRAPSTTAASEGSSEGMEGAGHSRRQDRSSRDEPAPLLPAPDLDPRVLCNTGWGQTPVRQHTSWDMEEAARTQRKADAAGADSWGGSGPNTPTEPAQGPSNPSHGPPHRADLKSDVPGPGPQAATGWGGSMPPASQLGSGWGEPPSSKNPPNGPGGWGNPPPGGPGPGPNMPKAGNQSWGAPEEKSPSWDDPHGKAPKPQGWGDGPKLPHSGWGNSAGGGGNGGGGDWREPADGKKNSPTTNPPWEGEGAGGWKESNRGWGKPGPGMGGNVGGGGGWGEPAMAQQRPSGPAQGWGGKPQESSNGNSGGVRGGSMGGAGGGEGSMGSWGGPGPVKPSVSGREGNGGGGGSKQDPSGGEPTGWEEPSPPSIRRKMEIDDGTSAWGDPGAYNKTVNLWDKNNPGGGGPPQGRPPGNAPGNAPACPPGNNNNHPHPPHHPPHHPHTYHGPPPPLQSHGGHNPQGPGQNSGPMDPAMPHQAAPPPHSRPPLMGPGWGEPSSAHPKPEPSWGEPAPPPVSVDNGTSAWGKPTGSHGGWGVGDNSPEPYRRGNPPLGSAPCKPAPKSMQDGWGGGSGGGGEDMGLSGGQWDPDDGDMWSSQASQESNSWGNRPRKGPPKGKILGKQEEAWIMNRLIKQLTDMGFPRDPAEEALKRNNMNLDQAMSALLEKKTELDRRGMGMSDYNNCLINKGPMGCRPPLHSKESSSDRSSFLDKDGVGSLVEDVHTSSPFMPCSPGPLGLKLPSLPSTALPLSSQGLGGPQGLAMQNLNNRQMQSGMLGSSGAAQARAMQQPPPQPSVPPLGSSQPSLRAQVPQFLSPQAYQRLQIQQQMLQAQRNVSAPIRQQEQHVARTINNMQQQIQQHQRQLAQALLMKQQQTLGSLSSSGLHHGQGKSALDLFPGHPQAPGLPDLQTKEQQSSTNSYSPYPLSGLNPNMNVTGIEVGGLSMKELPQPQSRLSQWTHPNSMDSLSGGSSSLEPNLNKHGSNLGPPGKPPQMEDGYSPYGMMPGSESPTNPLVPPDSWSQGKSPNDKMVNGTNITWPPEFCPGVPWKGLQNIDPENDPNMTPGSVPSGPTINTNIQDVNRYLQRDRSGGKLSDMKSTWSPGPISHPSQVSLSHELWKVPQGPRSNTAAPTRPPPGLTNPTKHSSTWGGNSLGLAQGWSSSYSSAATTWSTDSSNRTSSWLVLRNLTPQIDGSTLRTLCMQHGPLITFHLNLTQGNALVRYSSKEEAAKAQKSLHMCVLGNTTILAEFAGEEEVQRFFAQGQQLASTTSWQADPGVNQTRMGGSGPRSSHPIGHPHWNSGGSSGGMGGGGAKTGGDLLWGGVPQYSSLWGPPSGEEGRVMGSPTPINTLLPGDLLSGESM